MKFRGGHNVWVKGRPSRRVEVLPDPDVLYLPLWSRRFRFSELCVGEGQLVHLGQVLAKDPANHNVPLLAPRAGTVRLKTVPGHITLENVAREPESSYELMDYPPHVPRDPGSAGMKRYRLLVLGAWQFLNDAHAGSLPDPFGVPQAVIVSTLRLEPFAARGDAQLGKHLRSFTRGLEHLQALLEYQPIHLVLPDIRSEFARRVREAIRGYAWVRLTQVPLRYPFDDFAVLARWLGFRSQPEHPVWGVRTEGVLAIDRALTLGKSCDVRVVSLGGPAVRSPVHLRAMAGYPIAHLLQGRAEGGDVRVINGGVLTGRGLDGDVLGLDAECSGLTVLPRHHERQLLGFVRPGWSKTSYSRCFLSALRPRRFRPDGSGLTTALGGELRACVACGYCEEVCPAGIMPHLIHKFLYQGVLEEAERARVDRCVRCGLCSFVCPSKIELMQQFVEAQETIRREAGVKT